MKRHWNNIRTPITSILWKIEFRVYIALGQEGLLNNFDISSIILNERGEWLETYRVNVAFAKSFCDILYEGLKLLSNSLDSTLARTNVKLPEIVEDANSVRHLIGYYEHHGNLTTQGAEIQSLSFLKAAGVCVIMPSALSVPQPMMVRNGAGRANRSGRDPGSQDRAP